MYGLFLRFRYRTWATDVTKNKNSDGTEEFCARSGEYECEIPNMPNCEDRTVVCNLDQIKEKDGMTLTDNSNINNTRNNGSFKAKFTYACEEEGKFK